MKKNSYLDSYLEKLNFPPGTVIAVVHQKGGVGKTTIADNIAVELSKKYTVDVIDLDLQSSTIKFNERRKRRHRLIVDEKTHKMLQVKLGENNYGEYLLLYERYSKQISKLNTKDDVEPLSDAETEKLKYYHDIFLAIYNEIEAHTDAFKPLNVLTFDNYADFQKHITTTENIVVIDSGGFDAELNRIAMIGADIIITPVSDARVELDGLDVFKGTIQKILEKAKDGFELSPYVLLNRIDPSASESSSGLIKELKDYVVENGTYFHMMDAVLRQRKPFKESYGLGQSVVEIEHNSKAANELKQLLINIERIING